MRKPSFIIAAALTVVATLPVLSQSQQWVPGVKGKKAPSWGVTEWYNLPEGTKSIDVTDFEGKVVYLFGFQAWCPGCHSHGFPALKFFQEQFADNEDIIFVAVQTVFEGHATNTAEAGLDDMREFGLDIPYGFDDGPKGKQSILMKRYRSGGTPWTVIIDRSGIVRYNDFNIKPDDGISLIRMLLDDVPKG